MIGDQLSLILLPTNKCNVACEYCFEDKTADFMTLDQLSAVIDKLLDHMEQQQTRELIIYWQGGEAMLMQPEWFEAAHALISEKAHKRGKRIGHSLQSNMIGYSRKWNKVIAEMFGNSVGTSMDFPNLYRKAHGHSTEEYTALWTRNVRRAREAGINIGVISIPNRETLRLGGEAFYSYFVDQLGMTDFQVNTSFSGGEINDAKVESILDVKALARFFVELADVWFERGYAKAVKLGPIEELLKHFLGKPASLPCIWQQNCADEFVSIDARGHVAQCDCWVTSYPEYRFGNIFGAKSFSQLMNSKGRSQFVKRPEALIEHETCAGCDYLSLCHGGCPVRAYSITGEFFVKDPYCEVYKALFSRMESLAADLSRARFTRSLPVLHAKEGKWQQKQSQQRQTGAVTVTLDNFVRAETDMYFAAGVRDGGLGKLAHARTMADIDNQTVVRMNCDTLYSSGVFDLDAGPVKIVLPDTGKRFMSMQVVNEDHYALEVVYGPAAFTYDKAKVGTRYAMFLIRTLANPEDAADMKAANAAQDAIKVEQQNTGQWEAPNWDKASQDKIRETLSTLGSMGYSGTRFGKKDEVDPIAHLIGAAVGWGGNPEYAAVYTGAYPTANDGKTVHRLTVKDVPVDGFWSISVYNEQGFFQKNDLHAYSLNSLTAKPDAGGSYTIQFGGCTKDTSNCLPIVAGWNYTVRLYRPRKEILDGAWKFPEAKP